MLINLSNHPSDKWSTKQLSSALRKYKSIVDLPFPHISPKATTSQVKAKAKRYLNKVVKFISSSSDKNNAVHLMGEFTFVYQLTYLLKQKNISIVVSTTNRIVEAVNGKKIVTFDFIRFREY